MAPTPSELMFCFSFKAMRSLWDLAYKQNMPMKDARQRHYRPKRAVTANGHSQAFRQLVDSYSGFGRANKRWQAPS